MQTKCRFGAPWELREISTINEDGIVQLKRNNESINAWNPVIASAMRCNHDISFVPTKGRGLALIHYITDYTTKQEQPVTYQLAIAAVVREAQERRDSKDPTSSEQGSSDDFVLKTFNKLGVEREIGAPEMSNALLDQPEWYSSSKFVKLRLNSVYWAMCNRFPHMIPPIQQEEEDEPDAMLTVTKGATVNDSFFQEYRCRGPALRDFNLYDYKSTVTVRNCEKKTRGFPFAEELASSRSTRAQFLCKDASDARVVSFTGKALNLKADEQRSKAILLGLFVPWEDIAEASEARPGEHFGAAVFDALATSFSPRTTFYISNIQLLRRSREDSEIDRRNFHASLSTGISDDIERAINDADEDDNPFEGEENTFGYINATEATQAALKQIVQNGRANGLTDWAGKDIITNVCSAYEIKSDPVTAPDIGTCVRRDIVSSWKT